ncbi:SDR family oxidoreductase [Pendulispora rubella]|uniref:SDR family oxidoreductase n=1 Tax=Pendulispora rubella TaxID=2741070 RepID=A0ABZ2L8V2_9BACT
MRNADIEVLVTGGTGFVGRWLLAALTARGRRVAAVVRRAAARSEELADFVAAIGGDPQRLMLVEGDVQAPSLGLEGAFAGVRDVFHVAGRYAFGMEAGEARRANVEGSLHAAEWALARPTLRRFVFVGGYRMTRPVPGLSRDAYPLREAEQSRLYRRHGAYEASKHESYLALQHFAKGRALLWTSVHPSSVIGDSRTGQTTQVLGLGDMVERLWRRKLPALVGTPRTFVPLVTVDYLASFLASVPERAETLGQELCVLDTATPPLPDLIRAVATHLGVSAPRLLLCAGLVRALPKALTGVEPETLSFLSEDRYDTAAAEAHATATGLEHPPLLTSVTRWCDYLVSTGFGTAASQQSIAMYQT